MKYPRETMRVGVLALAVLAVDQLSKLAVLRFMGGYHQQQVVVEGFFKLVLWGNTGAAWSMFHGRNTALTCVAVVALIVLFWLRRQFEIQTLGGQLALGLIFGGILGNLFDRIFRQHVVDFLYFYVVRRSGVEAGFPAFNLADTSIFFGVTLLFILSWRQDRSKAVEPAGAGS